MRGGYVVYYFSADCFIIRLMDRILKDLIRCRRTVTLVMKGGEHIRCKVRSLSSYNNEVCIATDNRGIFLEGHSRVLGIGSIKEIVR